MSFILPLLLFLILAACVGFLYPEGMWSNAIKLVSVVLSALLATNFYEPVARLAEEKIDTSFTFFYDYLCLWFLFAISMVLFRVLTFSISQVKVRFMRIADQVGSGVLSAIIGWVMVSFILMTLHTAPMARTYIADGFDPFSNMFLGMAPDRMWLSFAEWVSRGAYSTDPENVFDPGHRFIAKYAERRDAIDKYRQERNAFRVEAGDMDKVAPPP
jgi:uncharacterized membrane protein required for colicin V production